MSDYMAQKADDQITGALSENESLRQQIAALESQRDALLLANAFAQRILKAAAVCELAPSTLKGALEDLEAIVALAGG